MLYLPTIRCDEHNSVALRGWFLPIADQSAARLEQALLVDDADPRRVKLIAAILRDPFLAIWIHEATCSLSQAVISSVKDAADWLADGLAEKLAPAAKPAAPASDSWSGRPASGSVAGWHRIAPFHAARYARMGAWLAASALARSTAEPTEDPAYWQSLADRAATALAMSPRDPLAGQRLLPGFVPTPPPLFGAGGQAAMAWIDGTETAAVDSQQVTYLLEEIPGVEQRLAALAIRLAEFEASGRTIASQVEQEKLASLKQLAYGASHEINNPLANIAARAQTLLRDEPDADRRRKLSAIFDQAMRAHEMIADLMLFAHPPAIVPATCSLTAIAERTVSGMAVEAARNDVELQFTSAREEFSLDADESQLAVALGAVVRNSIEAVGHGGHVLVTLSGAETDASFASLIVRDDGPGIPDEVRRHLFDPFFSGREAGRGLGFGLTKCWRIVTDHGGQLSVESVQPHGAQFTISLPLARAA